MNVDIDRVEQIKKYAKYLLLIVPIVIIIILLKSCGGSKNYSNLENNLKDAVSNYIREKNLTITGEQYIDLTMLPEIEGLELCSGASGALVENRNGSLVITPYLDCKDYKSNNIKISGKYIELNGDAVMLLNKGEAFNDPLYVLKKECDVEIDGYVGSSVGIYTIRYNAYVDNEVKETLIRKVVVSNTDKTKTISGIESTTEPTLILYGDIEIVLSKGEKYVEPGYKAVDYEDGKVSRQVRVEPETIDTNKVGIYVIKYVIENSRGAVAMKNRTVNVVARKSNLTIDLTSTPGAKNSVVLKIKVVGNDYDYMYLPDRTKSISREASYEVKSNGTYSFTVYDRFGNRYGKEITVDSIDSIPPTGSCKAVVQNSTTNVSVTATDNKGIGGYNYIIDNKESGYITANTYEASADASSVKVKVKDISDNEATLVCEVEKKTNPPIISGQCGASNVMITINTCYGNKLIRKDVPLEEYLMGVLYGEEAPGMNDPEAYIKAFLIFARSYTLKRTNYWSGTMKAIKSCSSDQNWCDVDMGCYRDQTQEMFDLCIDYAVSYPRHDYTADTCANRVTTFPGTANVQNKTFYVSNPGWWGAKSVTSNHVRSLWHGPVSAEKKAFYQRMVEETAGLIIYDANGKPASVGYYMCNDTTKDSIMCPNTAEKLANQGYTMEQLIEAYTQSYQGRTVGCFNK